MINYIRILIYVAVSAFILVSALSFLGDRHWAFELLSQFRVQLLFASALGLLTCAALRFRQSALALGILALAHLIPVLGHMERSDIEARHPDGKAALARLSMLYLNMHHRHADHGAFLSHVRKRKPDIVVLTEVDPARRNVLFAALDRQYPNRLWTGDRGPFDMTVFSKYRLREIPPVPRANGNWPMIHAAVCPAGFARCAELIAVHAPRPGKRWTGRRNRVFAEVAARARAAHNPVIVVGDFNSTPWSPPFKRLMRQGRLRDGAAVMAALSPTWLSRTAPFGLGIDHVLISGDMFELRRRVGPAFGSDHFSVEALLAADLGALAPDASDP